MTTFDDVLELLDGLEDDVGGGHGDTLPVAHGLLEGIKRDLHLLRRGHQREKAVIVLSASKSIVERSSSLRWMLNTDRAGRMSRAGFFRSLVLEKRAAGLRIVRRIKGLSVAESTSLRRANEELRELRARYGEVFDLYENEKPWCVEFTLKEPVIESTKTRALSAALLAGVAYASWLGLETSELQFACHQLGEFGARKRA